MRPEAEAEPKTVLDRGLEIVQEHPEDAPAGWVEVQEDLAASVNLSLLLVDGLQPPALVASNNNSICHAFQSSPEYVGLCDPYCGDAHRRAMSAGTLVQYKCHAGLQCFTMPVQIAGQQNLAAIGGRAFVTGADYRSLVDRFRGGELNDLLPSEPFENVIFADAQRLEQLSERLNKALRNFESEGMSPLQRRVETETVPENQVEKPPAVAATPLEPFADPLAALASELVGDRDRSTSPEVRPDLKEEVERLRGELEYRTKLADSLQRFLQRISSTNPEKTYQAIVSHIRQLLQAERISLWVFNEDKNEIILRASTGIPADATEVGPIRFGEGILGKVLESGVPLVVGSLRRSGFDHAPADRKYKTDSFISYPIIIEDRKIGVLNVADKSGAGVFDEVDLSLLEIVGAQVAVALERAEWQERATQFQLMSITDPLTGLLNRRYLEERLGEELNRSERYDYPMSCMMIDIDDFKLYNDRNGHQAGDVALKITAHSLKAALRAADIACRYGGEEFCILLPQTSLTEAGVIAERISQRVAEADYPYGQSQPLGKVSISIGISTFVKNIDTAESVIASADRALYAAKHKGKDRIEYYVENLSDLSNPASNK